MKLFELSAQEKQPPDTEERLKPDTKSNANSQQFILHNTSRARSGPASLERSASALGHLMFSVSWTVF